MNKEIKNWILQNLANFVTYLGLLGAIWILVVAITNPKEIWLIITLAIFVCLTDLADGIIARELKQTSVFGAALDRLRDKVFVIPTTIILVWYYRQAIAGLPVVLLTFTWALISLIIFFEIVFLAGWWIFICKRLRVGTTKRGKEKTFAEFSVIIIWLISLTIERYSQISVFQYSIWLIDLALFVTALYTLASVKDYYQKYNELKIEKGGKNE